MKYNRILTSAALLATLSFAVTPAFAQRSRGAAAAARAEALELRGPRGSSAPRSVPAVALLQRWRLHARRISRAASTRASRAASTRTSHVASTRASHAVSTRTSRVASTRTSHAASTRTSRVASTRTSRAASTRVHQSRGVYYEPGTCRLPGTGARWLLQPVALRRLRGAVPLLSSVLLVPAALQHRFRAVDRLSGRVHGLVLLRLPVSGLLRLSARVRPVRAGVLPTGVLPAARLRLSGCELRRPSIHRRTIRRAALRSQAITSPILSRDRSSRSRERHPAA